MAASRREVGPLDEGLEDGALLGGELGGAEGRDGGPLDGVGGVAGELAGVDGPLAEAGDGAQRAGAGARLLAGGGEMVDVALERGDGEHIGAEGAAVGLGGEPGHQRAQGGEVGGDRLGVTAAERGDEGPQQLGVVIAEGVGRHGGLQHRRERSATSFRRERAQYSTRCPSSSSHSYAVPEGGEDCDSWHEVKTRPRTIILGRVFR